MTLYAQDLREEEVKLIRNGWRRFSSLFTYKRFLIGWIIWNGFFAGFDFVAMILDIMTHAGTFWVIYELVLGVFMIAMLIYSIYVYEDYRITEKRDEILNRLRSIP